MARRPAGSLMTMKASSRERLSPQRAMTSLSRSTKPRR